MLPRYNGAYSNRDSSLENQDESCIEQTSNAKEESYQEGDPLPIQKAPRRIEEPNLLLCSGSTGRDPLDLEDTELSPRREACRFLGEEIRGRRFE